jgi:cell wall-associated NlpC family hydrolase
MKITGRFRPQLFIVLLAGLFLASCHSSRHATESNQNHVEKEATKVSKKERNKKIDMAIKTAYSFKGTPYRIGGMDRKGMDCSGLVKVSFQSAGINLPRTTTELCEIGNCINQKHIEKGDLLFFATNKKKSSQINHVAIVSRVGDDEIYFIHASLQKGVMENKLSEKYYKEAFIKAIRPF